MQIEQYHDLIGLNPSDRVAEAFNYLTGPALKHCGTSLTRDKLPRTWEEFSAFILERFSHRSAGETIQRLSELRWEGFLDLLCTQFADILADGAMPPEHELIRLFITRLPLSMVRALTQSQFESWSDVGTYLRQITPSTDH